MSAAAMIALSTAAVILGATASPRLMAETDRPSPIESPCNKVCVIDAASGLCIGCGRTLAEIGSWISMTADERRRIMDELPARRAALSAHRNNLT
jgi:predicted Fe-S protein YdhL (DUF1289 family)